MAKLDKVTFIEALKEMTILEIKELVDAMKEEFGIDPSAVAAAPAAAAQRDLRSGRPDPCAHCGCRFRRRRRPPA